MHFEDGDSIITYPNCSRFWITNKYEPFLNNKEMLKKHSEELEEYMKKNPNTIILLNSGETFVKTYPTLIKGIGFPINSRMMLVIFHFNQPPHLYTYPGRYYNL